MLQVQYSLLDRRPENFMSAYCGAHDIRLLPYGVVAGGFLSNRWAGYFMEVPTKKAIPTSVFKLAPGQQFMTSNTEKS